MPFIYSQTTTTIEFDDPSNEDHRIILRVSNAQDEVLGCINVAAEKRISKVIRIKTIRQVLRPRDSDDGAFELSLRDALRFVEHCEANPYC